MVQSQSFGKSPHAQYGEQPNMPMLSPPPPPQLPPGWTQHDDGQGHIYYFNAQLNKSTWVRPVVIDMRDLK